jgi:hypothetical protein
VTQFHESRAGQKFLNGTAPRLVEQLEKLNKNLELLPSGSKHILDGIATGDPNQDKRKLAIILAGLRTLQRTIDEKGGQKLPLGILDILMDVPSVLSDEVAFCKEVDELCTELNE